MRTTNVIVRIGVEGEDWSFIGSAGVLCHDLDDLIRTAGAMISREYPRVQARAWGTKKVVIDVATQDYD